MLYALLASAHAAWLRVQGVCRPAIIVSRHNVPIVSCIASSLDETSGSVGVSARLGTHVRCNVS